MSNFRRHIQKNLVGKLVDVTDRFEKLEQRFVNPPAGSIGSKVTIGSDANHNLLIVQSQKGLFVDVAKYSESSSWPNGMISYVDDDDILIKGDAVCSSNDNINQVVYGQYNRFELKFPEGATRAYISSYLYAVKGGVLLPKVYKKIM